jgi:hypothetical protein
MQSLSRFSISRILCLIGRLLAKAEDKVGAGLEPALVAKKRPPETMKGALMGV